MRRVYGGVNKSTVPWSRMEETNGPSSAYTSTRHPPTTVHLNATRLCLDQQVPSHSSLFTSSELQSRLVVVAHMWLRIGELDDTVLQCVCHIQTHVAWPTDHPKSSTKCVNHSDILSWKVTDQI
ncbi:hypothetical protein J6590_025054 [Homalodisca vitripennis]|nr:hypothetical protein J6590_025054 [Homalodisca vitripennis]